MSKKKRPILKIVLIVFGAIIVVSVIANIAGGGSDSNSSPGTVVSTTASAESGETTVAPQKKSSPQYIKAGMYKVESELPAGEYIIEATGSLAYYQISSDSSGEFDSIIVNDTLERGAYAYIIVQNGDYVKIESSRMINAANHTITPKDLNDIPSSTYKVGKDIPAGEYKLTPTSEMAYWERSRNPRSSIDGIIANDVLTKSAYVTVHDGEYFKIAGAQGQKVD
jgi:hypothetical protein